MVSEREGWEPLQPTSARNKKPNLREEQEKQKWIEEWLARFRPRSSTEETMHRGHARCTSTYSGMDTGAMSMERMTQHPNRHIETSRPRNNRRAEFSTTSHPVWANNSWATFGMEDAEGWLGKSEKDFCRKHHSQKAPTPTWVEQCATTRLVCAWLHLEDNGYLWFSRLHRCECWGRRNGADLPLRISVKVRSIPNCCLYKGEYTVLFRLAIDAPCR